MPPAIRNKSEFIAALCLAAFGAYVAYVGGKLPYSAEVGPGSGFFPFWIGSGLMIFSGYQIVLSVSSARAHNGSSGPSWRGSGRALSGWLTMIAAIFLFRWLGFAISFVLLTIFYMVVLERRPVLLALAVGAALALAFHLLFVMALGVSLPAGPWGF